MIKLLAVFAVLYGIYNAMAFMAIRQILFPVKHIPSPPPGFHIERPDEVIEIPQGSGASKAWLYLPADTEAGHKVPAVIYAHGNGERIEFCTNDAKLFLSMGIAVCLVEYPGYGDSGGKPGEKSITSTFTVAYDMIAGKPGIDPERIIGFGRSLGGGAICSLSMRRKLCAMILVSTFTRIRAFTDPYGILPFLLPDRFDNLHAVKRFPGPVLIFHGTKDEIIPYSHGMILAENARNVEFVSYRCGHNDMPPDPPDFRRRIQKFLERNNII